MVEASTGRTSNEPAGEDSEVILEVRLGAALTLVLGGLLLVLGTFGLLATSSEHARASSPLTVAASGKQFYLTPTFVNGTGPPTACASGYHFASFWEIADPSNLRYNVNLGVTRDDSGQGPPSGSPGGWVRTGFSADNGPVTGSANCLNWSTTAGEGTVANLQQDWINPTQAVLDIWHVNRDECSEGTHTWCIED